jgi:hypothetical protein
MRYYEDKVVYKSCRLKENLSRDSEKLKKPI